MADMQYKKSHIPVIKYSATNKARQQSIIKHCPAQTTVTKPQLIHSWIMYSTHKIILLYAYTHTFWLVINMYIIYVYIWYVHFICPPEYLQAYIYIFSVNVHVEQL